MNKEFIYECIDVTKKYKSEIIIPSDTKILKKKIDFEKIAIIDFEAVSYIRGNEYSKNDFFEDANSLAGVPISCSLILKNKNKSELFNFELLSIKNIGIDPKIYKKELTHMLKKIVDTIPEDYKIVVWGAEFEKIIFSFINRNIIKDIKRREQFINILDLQKIFSDKIKKKTHKIQFNVNFKNEKNTRFFQEEKKLNREITEYASFSYDDYSLEELKDILVEKETLSLMMRSNRSLDFIPIIIKLIMEDNHELDMKLFKTDRDLFEEINVYFRENKYSADFINKLKKYNNTDVEGILLIFTWLNNKIK